MKLRDFFAEAKAAPHLQSRFLFPFGWLIVITTL